MPFPHMWQVAPGALVMLSPILCGIIFGTKCVTGLLAGGIASGIQMALSSSNTGGAWDNAKKYISKGAMDAVIAKEEPETVGANGKVATKKSQIFKAAVTGDTVGDPLKDTSGPALNILMKLMAIISVVFAPLFLAINEGGGLISLLGGQSNGTAVDAPPRARRHLLESTAPALPSASSELTSLSFGLALGVALVLITQSLIAPPRRAAPREAHPEAHKPPPLLVCRTQGIDGTGIEHMALARSAAA